MSKTLSSTPTLEDIVSSNLEMLESQEAELERTLKFVRKVKALFKGNTSKQTKTAKRSIKKVGRPRKKKAGMKASTARETTKRKTVYFEIVIP